jgi:hypothetical protein
MPADMIAGYQTAQSFKLWPQQSSSKVYPMYMGKLTKIENLTVVKDPSRARSALWVAILLWLVWQSDSVENVRFFSLEWKLRNSELIELLGEQQFN